MRELTLLRRMCVVNGLSAAAVALLAMAPDNMLAAQTIHEPRTTLRIIEPGPMVAESPLVAENLPRMSTRDEGETYVVIRNTPANSTPDVVASRLSLEVAASRNHSGMAGSRATGKTELRLNPLPDSSRIIAHAAAGHVPFNALRSDEVHVGWPSDTSFSSRPFSSQPFSSRPSTYASNVTPRPNVLRMGDGSATPDRVRVVSYQDGSQSQAWKQADGFRSGEPRERAFSAAPLDRAAERLGPFEVTDQLEVLSIVQRCGKVLRTTRRVERTKVADPNVCAVVQFTPGELSIVAKQAGQTQVTFWFEGLQGRPISYLIHVVPNPLAR